MIKILKYLSILTISTSISINNGKHIINKVYYDDRSKTQLADANYIINHHFNLNPNKHVLLLGYDGVQYEKLSKEMKNNSDFAIKYNIQNYETEKGWTSVLWGNILKQEKDIFSLIKANSNTAKTANITQWMGSRYYNSIYSPKTTTNIDYNYDFNKESSVFNYNTPVKMEKLLTKLVNLTINQIKNDDTFIFSYNAFYVHLKHLFYLDNSQLIKFVLTKYSEILNSYYQQLDPSNWLIINVTDHGRNKLGFNHFDFDQEAHIDWTLSNHNLDNILGHKYINFYDIRTITLKWLSS